MSEKSKLRDKAIAAYESSDLREEDRQRNEMAVREITRFLSKFGINIYVNANPFRIDDLTFYGSEDADIDGIFGYDLIASRQCPECKEQIVLNIDDSVSPARFGQWLLQPHVCEFFKEARKPVPGLTRKGTK